MMILDGWRFARNMKTRRRNASRRRSTHQLSQHSALFRLEDRCLLATNPLGGEAVVNLTTSGAQHFSANSDRSIDVLNDGTVVATWTSRNQIVARLFDANGTPRGPEFAVSTSRRGTRGNPVVAAQGSDRFAIAWVGTGSHKRNVSTDVFARTFFENGTPLTPEIRINESVAGTQRDASLAWISPQEFVVAWSGAGVGDQNGVFARVFNVSGAAETRAVRVPESAAGAQVHPVVVAVPHGGFQVAWSGAGADDGVGIYSRQFDSNANPFGAEFRVNSSPQGAEVQPTVTVVGSEQLVFAWHSVGGTLDAEGAGIEARRFALDGTPLGDEFLVNETDDGNQSDPSIASLSDGGFVITWRGRGSVDADGIHVREFHPNGNPRIAERLVNTTTDGAQAHPTVRARSTSGYVIAWSGNVGGPGISRASSKSRVNALGDKQGIALRQFEDNYLVNFAGYQWYTNYHYNLDSGYYDNGQQWAPQNVFVDQAGLHLLLQSATVGGKYTAFSSAEAVLVNDSSGNPFVPGYGTYLVSASTSGSFNRLASNNGAIFGAFTYENIHGPGTLAGNSITGVSQDLYNQLKVGMLVEARDYTGASLLQPNTTIQSLGPGTNVGLSKPAIGSGLHTIFFTDESLVNGHRELDMVEASRFGIQTDPTNAQFTLQPYADDPANVHRITLQDQGEITLVMNWTAPEQPVTFSAYYGILDLDQVKTATAAFTWTTDPTTQNQFIPNTYYQTVHLNFWVAVWANLPTPQNDEVIVKNFQYQPLT